MMVCLECGEARGGHHENCSRRYEFDPLKDLRDAHQRRFNARIARIDAERRARQRREDRDNGPV